MTYQDFEKKNSNQDCSGRKVILLFKTNYKKIF